MSYSTSFGPVVAGQLLFQKTTLTAGQTLALGTTAIAITPTPAANVLIYPVAVITVFKYGTIAYTGTSQLLIEYMNGTSCMNGPNSFLLQTSSQSAVMRAALTNNPLSSSLGAPLSVLSQGGALSSGNGTLEVFTWYQQVIP